jgi:ubiquinone/menaquinone biosynthesis C-methylase UbiE
MKEFWEEQASKYGEGVAAVNFDPIEDNFAGTLYQELVPDKRRVADLGCGNGRTSIELAQRCPGGKFIGFDFAENMVRVAEERRQRLEIKNVLFRQFDVTATDLPDGAAGAFDIVIGKRLLINIKGDSKRRALRNIHKMLTHDGTYIMTECFIEPLDRINDIRATLDLERIGVKFFNEYLSDAFMEEINKYFTVERKIDIGSLYYFISRVFNSYLSGGKPDYFAPINQLASKLVLSGVRPMQGYAPEVTLVLKKRAGAA